MVQGEIGVSEDGSVGHNVGVAKRNVFHGNSCAVPERIDLNKGEKKRRGVRL
jgi:hypothetical protein